MCSFYIFRHFVFPTDVEAPWMPLDDRTDPCTQFAMVIQPKGTSIKILGAIWILCAYTPVCQPSIDGCPGTITRRWYSALNQDGGCGVVAALIQCLHPALWFNLHRDLTSHSCSAHGACHHVQPYGHGRPSGAGQVGGIFLTPPMTHHTRPSQRSDVSYVTRCGTIKQPCERTQATQAIRGRPHLHELWTR